MKTPQTIKAYINADKAVGYLAQIFKPISNNPLTVEVEINFKEGKKTITMQEKAPCDIIDCKIENVVVIKLKTGDVFIGTFDGIDDDENIKISALSRNGQCRLKVYWISSYLEQF